MLPIDDAGEIVPTNIVQSIQVRAFPSQPGFAEFRMRRADLFEGRAGGLRPVAVDERDFITFSAQGMDPFEAKVWRPQQRARVIETCPACHQQEFRPGLASVLSLRQMVRPYT